MSETLTEPYLIKASGAKFELFSERNLHMNFSSLFQQFGLTIVCIAVMCLWFLGAKPQFLKDINNDPFREYEEPQTASSLGVFFTFVGISFGLFFFQPQDIDHLKDHLSGLLSGMTSAFFTSLVGMGMSFWMKHEQQKIQRSRLNDDTVSSDADIKDLIEYLQKSKSDRQEMQQQMLNLMKENNEMLQQTISESIRKMTTSIVGDGEYTVIGQMKTIRLEMRDQLTGIQKEIQEGNDQTLEAFQHFAKTLAENNTKAFIQALTDTMKDFNEKLTTQFGENFKELNVAVGRMLDWQKNYMALIEEMTKVQQETFKGVEDAKNSLSMMAQSSEKMLDSANKLADMIVTASIYEAKLEAFLNQISILGEKAEEAVPSIYNLMENTSISLQNTAKVAQDEIARYTTSSMDEFHNTAEKAITDFVKASEDASQETVNSMQNQVEKVRSYIEECAGKFGTAYQTAFDSMTKLAALLEKDTNTFDEHTKTVMEKLNHQVNDAIIAMEQASRTIIDTSKEQRTEIQSMSSETMNAVKAAADSLKKDSLTITQSISDNMQTLMQENNDALKGSVRNLQNDLHDNLTESLNSFGRAMAQLSKKFAEDYEPLTEKLRQVVHIADGIEMRRK